MSTTSRRSRVRYTRQDEAPTVEQYLDTITAAASAYLPAGARLVIEPAARWSPARA